MPMQQSQQTNPSPRLGPRPLALHLMTNAATWLTSFAALPSLKNGSLVWRPELGPAASALAAAVNQAGPDAWERFSQAVATEAARRHSTFLKGIWEYRHNKYRRPEDARFRTLWAEGTTRVADCRAYYDDRDHPVLLIPSLINRSYILDLSPRTSVARALAKRGLAPFLVDWDRPGPEEMDFDLTDYVTKRLEPALEAVREKTGRPVVLAGYCMGGLLALATALRRPQDVAGLVLLAAPWDFHAGLDAPRLMLDTLAAIIDKGIETMGEVPVDLLQFFISSVDPYLVSKKFTAFADLPPTSPQAREFIRLEDWVNDGVPLSPKVAFCCFNGWYRNNDTMAGRWTIADSIIDPEQVRCPSLVIIPDRDKIVTPASAHALGQRLPHAKVLQVPGGHVGMLLSRQVGARVHAPIARWIKALDQSAACLFDQGHV
jgi:polyhydroxyalkanoate synthase